MLGSLSAERRERHTTHVRLAEARRRFLKFFPGGSATTDTSTGNAAIKPRRTSSGSGISTGPTFWSCCKPSRYGEIAARAIRIESRTNLLFSFEKMALRDAIRTPAGARVMAEGLYKFLHGRGSDERRFAQWCEAVAVLPRRQTRVLTWPVVTVFGFIAQPRRHMFLKPNVTRVAAARCGYSLDYASKPNWSTYSDLLDFAGAVRHGLVQLAPRDMIDIQSFLWVQGSDEYRGRVFRSARTTQLRVPTRVASRSRFASSQLGE